MGNLENILHEKDNESAKIKSAIASALSEEEKKYQKSVKEVEKQGCINLNKLNEDYTPKLTEALITDLTSDSKIMNERSKYFSLPKEKIEEAVNLKKSISDLKSKAKSKKEFERPLSVLLGYLPQETKDLIDMPGIENVNNPVNITTYVSSNGEGCYILTPITDKPSDKLSKDIEERLLGVITRGKVIKGRDYLYFRGESPDYANGFLFFKIISESTTPEVLAAELINKINDEHIQPDSLKESKITHVAKPLDYNIFKNFLKYNSLTEKETSQRIKKKGRPFGSKNKKNIETTVSEASQASIESNEPAEVNPFEYDSLKSRYDVLTQKYGHNPTRTELGLNHKDFYKDIKDAEAKYGKFDFIPQLKGGPKNKK